MAYRITCLIPTCKNTCGRNNTKTTFLEIFFIGYHFRPKVDVSDSKTRKYGVHVSECMTRKCRVHVSECVTRK